MIRIIWRKKIIWCNNNKINGGGRVLCVSVYIKHVWILNISQKILHSVCVFVTFLFFFLKCLLFYYIFMVSILLCCFTLAAVWWYSHIYKMLMLFCSFVHVLVLFHFCTQILYLFWFSVNRLIWYLHLSHKNS